MGRRKTWQLEVSGAAHTELEAMTKHDSYGQSDWARKFRAAPPYERKVTGRIVVSRKLDLTHVEMVELRDALRGHPFYDDKRVTYLSPRYEQNVNIIFRRLNIRLSDYIRIADGGDP